MSLGMLERQESAGSPSASRPGAGAPARFMGDLRGEAPPSRALRGDAIPLPAVALRDRPVSSGALRGDARSLLSLCLLAAPLSPPSRVPPPASPLSGLRSRSSSRTPSGSRGVRLPAGMSRPITLASALWPTGCAGSVAAADIASAVGVAQSATAPLAVAASASTREGCPLTASCGGWASDSSASAAGAPAARGLSAAVGDAGPDAAGGGPGATSCRGGCVPVLQPMKCLRAGNEVVSAAAGWQGVRDFAAAGKCTQETVGGTSRVYDVGRRMSSEVQHYG